VLVAVKRFIDPIEVDFVALDSEYLVCRRPCTSRPSTTGAFTTSLRDRRWWASEPGWGRVRLVCLQPLASHSAGTYSRKDQGRCCKRGGQHHSLHAEPYVLHRSNLNP